MRVVIASSECVAVVGGVVHVSDDKQADKRLNSTYMATTAQVSSSSCQYYLLS